MKYIITIVSILLLVLWLQCLPNNLFDKTPYSTVVIDKNGELLGARLADDGQWRFPPCDTISDKFIKAIIEFEDRDFYSHPGVSVKSLVRAFLQNIRNGKIVSGGSTITMQVIRLSRQKDRTFWQKIIEVFMALRLETKYTKDEILKLYVSHAPFGGNVVGLNAALWRYLGNGGVELSWAEASTLAVSQNAPSLIHLNKNRDALLSKRNRLLTRLYEKGFITHDDYILSLEEPLIGKPYPMPQYAPHLVDWYNINQHGKLCKTEIDISLQSRLEEITGYKSKELREYGINDLSVVVMNVKNQQIVAYCGNSDMTFEREGKWVDIARSPRSSGSILKPLLYALSLQEGLILPNSLLPDIPTDFGGFAPKNFDGTYMGAVSADEALALSLNIPSTYLLKEYGISRFIDKLNAAGFTTINHSKIYGLSIILGGAEVTLIDVVSCYAGMAKCYIDSIDSNKFPIYDKVALYNTFNALREVNRPDQIDWQRAISVQNVAWKTGTSYGARDAWAIGVTPEYVVGVWAGNAEGSGVAQLTGASIAGPIMFDVFNILPYSKWFEEPIQTEGVIQKVCGHSGYIASKMCENKIEKLLPKNSVNSRTCPYCKEYPISIDGNRRVTNNCEAMYMKSYFVLPPLMENYYKRHHQNYEILPPSNSNQSFQFDETMNMVYPKEGSIIALTKQIDGNLSEMVCKAVHSNPSVEIFWHLDGNYIGSTIDIHQISIQPSIGFHKITIVDSNGNQQSVSIIIK